MILHPCNDIISYSALDAYSLCYDAHHQQKLFTLPKHGYCLAVQLQM